MLRGLNRKITQDGKLWIMSPDQGQNTHLQISSYHLVLEEKDKELWLVQFSFGQFISADKLADGWTNRYFKGDWFSRDRTDLKWIVDQVDSSLISVKVNFAAQRMTVVSERLSVEYWNTKGSQVCLCF